MQALFLFRESMFFLMTSYICKILYMEWQRNIAKLMKLRNAAHSQCVNMCQRPLSKSVKYM